MSNSAIAVQDLHLTLGGKLILDSISTELCSGQLTVLLGPNGTGKSSLLKLASREWPAKGKVSYFGKSANNWDRSAIARHLGVLPQSSTLTFNFSVEEVVMLGGMTLDASQDKIHEIAIENMRQCDIVHLSQRLYPSLSGGEKQRVHLARVLTQLEQSGERCVLLLDEPTSALDLSHQHKTLELARSMAKKGACVVIVLHDLNLAAQYGDRVMILNKGKIVADGTPWETLTEKMISDVYKWQVSIIAHPERGHPVILS